MNNERDRTPIENPDSQSIKIKRVDSERDRKSLKRMDNECDSNPIEIFSRSRPHRRLDAIFLSLPHIVIRLPSGETASSPG